MSPYFLDSQYYLLFRKEIFTDLIELVKEGLQENILKGVCKVGVQLYWVPQKLAQIYTVIAYICMWKVA